jgi:hypothetical protein
VRLTKTYAHYVVTREQRRELAYEALLAAGRAHWSTGERVRVYRTQAGTGSLVPDEDDPDPRDYDVDYYVALLRNTFAARLARAFSSEDYGTVFADPVQLSLFVRSIDDVRPILRTLATPQR